MRYATITFVLAIVAALPVYGNCDPAEYPIFCDGFESGTTMAWAHGGGPDLVWCSGELVANDTAYHPVVGEVQVIRIDDQAVGLCSMVCYGTGEFGTSWCRNELSIGSEYATVGIAEPLFVRLISLISIEPLVHSTSSIPPVSDIESVYVAGSYVDVDEPVDSPVADYLRIGPGGFWHGSFPDTASDCASDSFRIRFDRVAPGSIESKYILICHTEDSNIVSCTALDISDITIADPPEVGTMVSYGFNAGVDVGILIANISSDSYLYVYAVEWTLFPGSFCDGFESGDTAMWSSSCSDCMPE